jgi:thiol-disulfide isomerase/thioredoxin
VRFAVLWLVACATVEPVTPPPPGVAPLAAIEASPDLDGALVGTATQPTIVVVFASWCGNCHKELAELDKLRAQVRVLGLNYRGHEEYDDRGSPEALRRYVAKHAPWLRVIPAGEQLYELLGRPPKIPTLYVYDRNGALVTIYDRRERGMPDAGELRRLLQL